MQKITIITINRNNAEGLRRTFLSVVGQTCRNFEYLVIDGASTDESVDVIKDFSASISHWISEPDSGLYNAMNKGVAMATGDYLFFLNSGDCLSNNLVIEKLISQLNGEDLVYGDIVVDNGNIPTIIKSPETVSYHKKYQHHLPPQPATFFKRGVIERVGMFEESYRIIADVVLISRLFNLPDIRYKYIKLVITNFDTKGVSSNDGNQKRIYLERKKFILAEFPQYLADFENVYKKGVFRRAGDFIKKYVKCYFI